MLARRESTPFYHAKVKAQLRNMCVVSFDHDAIVPPV
jgi:hypothetical protein